MRRALLAAAFLCLALPAATSALPPPKRPIDSYCSTTGDLCYGIYNAGGIVFRITTQARYFARYSVCVRPPRGATRCRSAPLQGQGSVWGSSIRWPRGYGDHGLGVYRVTWKQAGRRLGPTLRFTRR
jgi:hypothetical protein